MLDKRMIFLTVITVVVLIVFYYFADCQQNKLEYSFRENYKVFKDLEQKSTSFDYLSFEKFINSTRNLDSISRITGFNISSIDFSRYSENKIIYVRTEPYYDYTGFFYHSNSSTLDCLASGVESLKSQDRNIKVSIKRLNSNWISYMKNIKDIPIDILLFSKVENLENLCQDKRF